MKKTRKKIGVALLLIALLVSTVIIRTTSENRSETKQVSAIATNKALQKGTHENLMIFKSCIDYFSNLSKMITQ